MTFGEWLATGSLFSRIVLWMHRRLIGIPLIAGDWYERENPAILVHIEQSAKGQIRATSEFSEKGETIAWEGQGTISSTGEIRLRIVHTKRPSAWNDNQFRDAILKPSDSNTIYGYADWGDGGHAFRWRKRPTVA
jgi:hypothetical protein